MAKHKKKLRKQLRKKARRFVPEIIFGVVTGVVSSLIADKLHTYYRHRNAAPPDAAPEPSSYFSTTVTAAAGAPGPSSGA